MLRIAGKIKITAIQLWVAIIALPIILWGLSWILISNNSSFCGWEQRAQFGGMFGAVGALFSGLAFAAIIASLYLQRKQNAKTENNFYRQQFENTFFKLLDLHHKIVDKIKYGETDGRECFKSLFNQAHGCIKGKETFQTNYKTFFDHREAMLGHYFRNLYTLIKQVDKSDIEDRRQYTNIVRAQLSKYEIGLLTYNGLSKEGEGFKPLIERYSLLKQAHLSEIHSFIKKEYREIAFGFEKMTDEEIFNFPKDFSKDYEKIKPRIDEEILKRKEKRNKSESSQGK